MQGSDSIVCQQIAGSRLQRGGRRRRSAGKSQRQTGNDNATADEVNAMDNYADELDELWASTGCRGEEAAAVGGGAGTWTPSDPVTHCLINAKPTRCASAWV